MLFSNQTPAFEYNLRLVPTNPLYSQIVNLKSEFIRYFGAGLYSRSSPHITIASFCMNTQNEMKLLRGLEDSLTDQNFPVRLHQVSGFDNIGMVVIDVAKNQVLMNQISLLQKVLKFDLKLTSKNFSVIDRFHITIGRASNSLDYRKAILLLNTLEYDREFTATEFVLAKRPFGEQTAWQPCYKFELHEQVVKVA
jgi:2'-5' RNA ligase